MAIVRQWRSRPVTVAAIASILTAKSDRLAHGGIGVRRRMALGEWFG